VPGSDEAGLVEVVGNRPEWTLLARKQCLVVATVFVGFGGDRREIGIAEKELKHRGEIQVQAVHGGDGCAFDFEGLATDAFSKPVLVLDKNRIGVDRFVLVRIDVSHIDQPDPETVVAEKIEYPVGEVFAYDGLRVAPIVLAVSDNLELVLLVEQRVVRLGLLEIETHWRKLANLGVPAPVAPGANTYIELHGRAVCIDVAKLAVRLLVVGPLTGEKGERRLDLRLTDGLTIE